MRPSRSLRRSYTGSLVFKLIHQADAAARIVLRRRALDRGRAVSQPSLQLQVLGQIHIRFELARSQRGLLRLDVNALADVATGRDAGAGILRAAGRIGGRTRPDRQPGESQTSLNFDERIETAVAAHAAPGRE